MLAGEGEALTRKAVELALADAAAQGAVTRDAAQATRLCVADQAAAALAAISDTPEAQRVAGGSPAQDRGRGDPFNAKIPALARGFAARPPPDFAKASLAELYAWSLTQPPAE